MGEGAVSTSDLSHHKYHIPQQVAMALGLPIRQVSVCIDFLDSGATIPFIARYRKEATGALDDAEIFLLAGHLDRVFGVLLT